MGSQSQTMCKIDSQWESAYMYSRELSLVLCDDLCDEWREGSGWEGGSRGRGYTYTYSCFTFVQEKLTQHSKALRVKKLA